MESRLKDLGWKLLDFLFPPSCAGCGKWGSRYCAGCLEKTQIIQPPVCRKCGIPINTSADSVCISCVKEYVSYRAVRSWAQFEPPLQIAIHRLKYKNDIGLAEALAMNLLGILLDSGWYIDLIVPVPLDKKRMKERGYNQSSLLGKTLASLAELPFSDQAVWREKTTRSQIGLTREERKVNVRNAFRADSSLVSGKKVLIVDDVVTTGSTINSCSQALIDAGAKIIYGLTLARSVHL